MATHPVSFDFDRVIARETSHCVKYDHRLPQFGDEELLPLWVADMDFACPPAVTAALLQRASHPIYGYSVFPEGVYSALSHWLLTRHQWSVAANSIVMCPGVLPSLCAAILAFSQPGDGIIIQPPVYFPFFSLVTDNQRRIIENPLRLTDKRYHIDFDHLRQCAAQGAKLLLLCSPHNPVGRVWHKHELLEILRIAREFNLMVVSDEIHADLVYTPHQHLPLATLAQADDRLITAVAPSKTFNVAGLGLSSVIINRPADRKPFDAILSSMHVSARNPFSLTAFEAAYRQGGEWKDALMRYLQSTRDAVVDYVKQHMPGINVMPAEATFLLWLDCRSLGFNDQQLAEFFWHQAKVGINAGISFGQGGSGFMRLNIAAPRSVVMQALRQIEQALTSIRA